MAEINSRAYEVSSLTNLLMVNNDGDDLAALDEDFRKVVGAITSHVTEHGGDAKGELTIKIVVSGDAKGLDVAISGVRKLPARPTSKARYFATREGDALTLKNPNRETMFPGQDLGRRRAGDPI